ncbi:MAG: hypothetical protein HMLKMBBP_03287 [Planctomycetes bacterium]|nr:hypothetical protein [Planctomycetota bacterium]
MDATDARYAGALRELTGIPGIRWEEVAAVLRGRRAARHLRPMPPPVVDDAGHGAYWASFAWDAGKVRPYALGDDAGHWYTLEVPEGASPDRPAPVWFDLGLFSSGAPPGFACVRLNERIPSAAELGTAKMSMTAGFAIQSIVLSVVADLERRFPVDRDRVLCGGYSRSGNAALYEALHWPDLWAGAAVASGWYEFDDAFLPNLRGVSVLAAWGADAGHRDSNAGTRRLAERLEAAAHGAVTRHASEGRAVEGLDAPFLAWVQTPRRDPLPRKFNYTMTDPRHRGAYWAEIESVRTTGALRTVVIGAPGDDSAERFQVHGRTATLTVEVTSADAVTVRASNVASAKLRLSPDLFDLSKPLRVTAGGRTTPHVVTPSIETLLANYRRDGDPRRLFPAEIRVTP